MLQERIRIQLERMQEATRSTEKKFNFKWRSEAVPQRTSKEQEN